MDKPIKRLGSGGIGSVFQTRWKNNIIAVKVFDMNNMNISEKDFLMEAIILSKLRHPNIITFYGISSSPTKRFIAMECLEKSLDNLVTEMQNQSVQYSLTQKLEILTNVANGILYLHTLSPTILHRDLKPANILIDRFGVCKLCDFGLSKMLSNYRTSVTSQIGTCYYLSPEMISSNSDILGEDARAIDIYSFSIIIWQVLFECTDPYMSRNSRVLQKLRLEEPSNVESSYQLHKGICENNLRPIIPFTDLEECKEWCKEFDSPDEYERIFDLTELIRQSWSPVPSTRPNIQEIVDRLEKIYNA
ncbi:predicted protein [Naegleria gruberi]|uniref:Predicted protein n=1 Tax=Naegleria gruberi TaxID=5762 RepID=D2V8X1_NAEGR|nr:uncharacterized protein NAEGRDRAFT_32030 [Naegleria gruberi]EFC46875.1 predicted protein [Naegleria gruberi]|eukprot:XP_002679619.1 predicted protein [Naegleria gruberi strain NEG-M]